MGTVVGASAWPGVSDPWSSALEPPGEVSTSLEAPGSAPTSSRSPNPLPAAARRSWLDDPGAGPPPVTATRPIIKSATATGMATAAIRRPVSPSDLTRLSNAWKIEGSGVFTRRTSWQ